MIILDCFKLRENQRKCLKADIDLKLRAIYYNKMDPTDVEKHLKSVFGAIPLLEDVQFLLKYAVSIFPEEAESITGEGVSHAMFDLQALLTEQREAVTTNLISALGRLYPDMEPEKVGEVGLSVAELFR